MSKQTHSVLLNIPAPLMELIEKRVQKAEQERQPGDFTRVSRTAIVLNLLYAALDSSPEAGLITTDPRAAAIAPRKRTTRY